MTTQSYKINNFNITLSSIDDVIYIKIVDNISFETYENNVDFDYIKLPFDKNDILNIICDCFSLKENFNVSFLIKHNCLKLTFDILFNLKYKYNFDIILNEKNIKNEVKTEYQYNKEIKDLNDKFENMILTQEEKIQELLNTIENLNNVIECISYVKHEIKITYEILSSSFYINSKEINIHDFNINDENALKCFYRLETLKLHGFHYNTNQLKCTNDKLKILYIHLRGSGCIDSFNFLHNFPNLEELNIRACQRHILVSTDIKKYFNIKITYSMY